jgi:hypothetical protein
MNSNQYNKPMPKRTAGVKPVMEVAVLNEAVKEVTIDGKSVKLADPKYVKKLEARIEKLENKLANIAEQNRWMMQKVKKIK